MSTERVKQRIVPTKSELDERCYRVIELPNNLKAVLISDPTTDMVICLERAFLFFLTREIFRLRLLLRSLLASFKIPLKFPVLRTFLNTWCVIIQKKKNLPSLMHSIIAQLFLGTGKYPDENSYSVFINAHGGSSNAYTASEETNYQFEIQHPFFAEALDR